MSLILHVPNFVQHLVLVDTYKIGKMLMKLQIPQGLVQSDEEVEDTEEQHSQLTMWYMPCMPTLRQPFFLAV